VRIPDLKTLPLTRGQGPFDGDIFARIIHALHNRGYVILNDVFDIEQIQRLFIDIKDTDSRYFHMAGIGREQDHQLNRFVRRDRICWLDRSHQPVQFYLDWAEQLRQRLNREFFLGLFDYECHYAHYQKGAFYKKHLDAFKGNSNRRLSSILYLNPNWQAADGGELVLYAGDGETVLETVLPSFGTMVLFLSEEFPHEVLPAKRSRYSLTGWYRVNTSNSLRPDPPK
jgi:SM-20-related protein